MPDTQPENLTPHVASSRAEASDGVGPDAADSPARTLTDADAYTDSLARYVTDSPTSYHAVAAAAARLQAAGFTRLAETEEWTSVPERGYTVRDGAFIAWMLPAGTTAGTAGETPAPAPRAFRILGAHTDSPALKLKPAAALARHGFQLVNAEVYGGPLLNSFLDRELGLAGRLVTRDGACHLVRTGPIARVAQVAPHLDRSVNDSLHLDAQANLLPLWTLLEPGSEPSPRAVEDYLCEVAGIDPAELVAHDVLTYPTEAPARFGRRREFLASSRLDNLSSVSAGLVALEALAAGVRSRADGAGRHAQPVPFDAASLDDAIVLIANDHEEVGSGTRSGAAGPFLESVLERLARALGVTGEAYSAMLARSVCVSADAGHSIHPEYASLHDPAVQPVLGRGPLVKINARQRYATDAVGTAVWARACRAAGVPSQDFVSNNAVPCGTTIGPITAARLGITTVDIGQPLLSMHSQREMCAVTDGAWMAQAIAAYWAGAQD